MVFDNIHKNDIKHSDWVNDFVSPTRYVVKKTKL